MQHTAPNRYRPMYYSSRKLSAAERNYSTTEREALRMIYSINMFRHYLLVKKVTFHVDHAALLYLVSKQTLTGKLTRWMLLLQEFEFDIQHWPGMQHAVADYLSRIENGANTVNGDDDFPDGAILHIEAEDPEGKHISHEDKCLIEMSTFLSTGLPPPRMRTDEKKRLVVGKHVPPNGKESTNRIGSSKWETRSRLKPKTKIENRFRDRFERL